MTETGKGCGIPEGGFRERGSVFSWLQNKPKEHSGVIAFRAAARLVPLFVKCLEQQIPSHRLLLPIFRCLNAGHLHAFWPRQSYASFDFYKRIADNAHQAADRVERQFHNAVDSPTSVALRVLQASSLVATLPMRTEHQQALAAAEIADLGDAAVAGYTKNRQGYETLASYFWGQLTADCDAFRELGTEGVRHRPLWFSNPWMPSIESLNVWLSEDLAVFKKSLSMIEHEHWQVWIDWYEGLLGGKAGSSRNRDIEFARLFGHPEAGVEITEDDWEAGPSVVNPKIRQVLDWFEARDDSKANAGNEDEDRANEPDPSISTLILQVLEQSDQPVRRGDILDYVRSRRPYTQPNSIGFRITELVRARRIFRVDRGLYTKASESDSVKELPATDDVQPQTRGAAQFRLTDDGRADLDASAGVLELLTDRDARDRHAETKRIAEKLKAKAQSSKTRGNANDEIVEGTELVLEALGDRVEDIRPGKLITRGESLRQFHEHNQKRDQYSDLPPLPDDVALLLANWISAYNQMVALDPVLSKADEARLGPDAKKNLVSPKQGRALAQSALEEGAATEEAVNALEEEAKVAPQVPDADNRNSVRHSEAQKNFVRTIVRGVVSTAKLGWKHKGKLTMGAGGSVAAAKWVLANQVTLLEMFANNPTMHQVIKTLIEFLKTMPLA